MPTALPKKTLLALLLVSPLAGAQLRPPVAPPGNPVTEAKARLGKVLFWDEQLSSSRTVSCGTCHMPEAGGADPRTARSLEGSLHPGADGVFGTDDDVRGSRGVPRADASGLYIQEPSFGLFQQVTGRRAPSAIGAGYAPALFWDGRASETLIDPQTGLVVLPSGAALESQALGPILSPVEMGHVGRTWSDLITRIQTSEPLALSDFVPGSLAQWISNRSYPELFSEAFGTSEVSPVRFAMAIATYERTLTPNRTPWDLVLAGTPITEVLTDEEIAGVLVFHDPDTGACASCHSTGEGTVRFTDDKFHYIGVAPQADDLGRFNVTGAERDRGSFKTPDLRNVELRSPYMHNGAHEGLARVIEFYNQGGDFSAPNLHADIRPLNLSIDQKRDLHAFLTRPLTDPRVAAGVYPFDRPSQYADSTHVPEIFGEGTAGSGGFVPEIVALEPPKLGMGDLTIGMQRGLGGATALLLVNTQNVPGGVLRSGVRLYPDLQGVGIVTIPSLSGSGPGDGWTSTLLNIPSSLTSLGTPIFAQWVVLDSGAPVRLSASRAVCWTWF